MKRPVSFCIKNIELEIEVTDGVKKGYKAYITRSLRFSTSSRLCLLSMADYQGQLKICNIKY